ncbi:MAG: hypothetical protein ABSG78_22500 [Verrucomicrobiota bacterium]|jgi:hypothetical protein
MKAKPNANTRTLRPDKCLVVAALSTGLRPGCLRNIGDNGATTREFRTLFVHLVTIITYYSQPNHHQRPVTR